MIYLIFLFYNLSFEALTVIAFMLVPHNINLSKNRIFRIFIIWVWIIVRRRGGLGITEIVLRIKLTFNIKLASHNKFLEMERNRWWKAIWWARWEILIKRLRKRGARVSTPTCLNSSKLEKSNMSKRGIDASKKAKSWINFMNWTQN